MSEQPEMRLTVTAAMIHAACAVTGDGQRITKRALEAALSAAPQPEPVGDLRAAYLRENLDVVLRAVEDMAKVGIEVAKQNKTYQTEARDRARIEFIREVCMRFAALSDTAGVGEPDAIDRLSQAHSSALAALKSLETDGE